MIQANRRSTHTSARSSSLKVKHLGVTLQHAGLDDQIELFVSEERRAPGDDLHGDLSERVEEPVRAGAEQSAELTVAEVKAHLEAADRVPLEKQHGDTSRPPHNVRRASRSFIHWRKPSMKRCS